MALSGPKATQARAQRSHSRCRSAKPRSEAGTTTTVWSLPGQDRMLSDCVIGLAVGYVGLFHGAPVVHPTPCAHIGRLEVQGGDDRGDLRAMLHCVTGCLYHQVG